MREINALLATSVALAALPTLVSNAGGFTALLRFRLAPHQSITVS